MTGLERPDAIGAHQTLMTVELMGDRTGRAMLASCTLQAVCSSPVTQ